MKTALVLVAALSVVSCPSFAKQLSLEDKIGETSSLTSGICGFSPNVTALETVVSAGDPRLQRPEDIARALCDVAPLKMAFKPSAKGAIVPFSAVTISVNGTSVMVPGKFDH